MHSLLLTAIKQKKIISAFFYGEGGFRLLEPFCFGTTAGGIEALRAFQTGGYSNTFTAYGWKLFRVDSMTSINLTPDNFSPNRPGYTPNDPIIKTIICQI